MKICPFCKISIPKYATICPMCHSQLNIWPHIAQLSGSCGCLAFTLLGLFIILILFWPFIGALLGFGG
jgi:predicted amidophosphoribosyltransferase